MQCAEQQWTWVAVTRRSAVCALQFSGSSGAHMIVPPSCLMRGTSALIDRPHTCTWEAHQGEELQCTRTRRPHHHSVNFRDTISRLQRPVQGCGAARYAP